MESRISVLRFPWMLGYALLALIIAAGGAGATSDNLQHELGVYSLYEYGVYGGEQWKIPVDPGLEADPYQLFWDLMTGGTSRQYAYHTSRRRLNSEVNYHTIFPIAGDGWKDWDQFDFVFFYGHNNMITPPHNCDTHDYWSNNPDGVWHKITGNQCDWGTSALPYEYYWIDLTDGESDPGSVTYLYEPFTSALPGYHFRPDTAWAVQTVAQIYPGNNSFDNMIRCEGGLGTNDLEWIVFHGCQAVIVANADGSAYHPLGVQAFRKTWDGFHIVMGHYRSFSTPALTDLSPLAFDLLGGVPMQAAYFRTTPMNRVAAISAEYFAPLDSPHYDPLLLDYWLGTLSCMTNDSWTNPRDDLSSGPNLWYTRWVQVAGTLTTHWIRIEPSFFQLILSRYFNLPEAQASQTLPGVNLATYNLRDQTLQKDLGISAIPIRAADYRLPPMSLPILKVEPVKVEELPARLKSLALQFAKAELSDQDIQNFGDILSAKVGSKVFWVSKASGAVSFTDLDQIMGAPTSLRDHRQALEIALKHVATEHLVELGPQESLDVAFVSRVMNAAVKNGELAPLRQYTSDYFVGLSRRYRGVPVVDSQLILRLGPDGRLLGLKKKWRPIAGEEGSVTITSASFNNQLSSFFQTHKILTPGQTVEQDVKILGSAWGYLEGPFCNEQQHLAPGALVNYRLRANYCDGDLVAQATIPLAPIDFPVLGSLKRFQPPPAAPDPVSDPDDIAQDEPN